VIQQRGLHNASKREKKKKRSTGERGGLVWLGCYKDKE
jgi:hypothetical protein